MTTIISVTLFLASVIGFGLLMKHFRNQGFKTRQNPVPQTPPKSAESPEEEFKAILDKLLKTNLIIRKDRDLPEETIVRIEAIIDDLKAVIPDMMARYPGETLTYEIKKIGRRHLGKTVKEFLDLTPASRAVQTARFDEVIRHLHETAHRAREIVEKNETAEFQTMARFLEQKFS